MTTWMVLLIGAFWLSAGPGWACLQAVLACRHHAVELAHSSGGHQAPAQGPCFCDEMTGGFDLVASPAVPAPLPVPVVAAAPEMAWTGPALFPLPPSPSLTPEYPPPESRA